MEHELKIDNLEHPVDAAGTVELARVSSTVVKTVVKAISDVVVAAVAPKQS